MWAQVIHSNAFLLKTIVEVSEENVAEHPQSFLISQHHFKNLTNKIKNVKLNNWQGWEIMNKNVLFIKPKKIYWNTIGINIWNIIVSDYNRHIKKYTPDPQIHTSLH